MDKFNDDYLRDLEKKYSELIDPKRLIQMFDNDVEFTEWAEMGTPEDIRAALIAFEKEELFNHCIILKRVLNTK
ncbi:hypothetical protein OAE73_00900 [bacterium]|nr:hypothetical protein [bacterium]